MQVMQLDAACTPYRRRANALVARLPEQLTDEGCYREVPPRFLDTSLRSWLPNTEPTRTGRRAVRS